MVKLTLFKNLLANLKQVPTPMLLASIAVHTLLLTIPISYSLTHKSSQPKPNQETTKTETVEVASIPKPSISTPSPSNNLFDPKKAMVPQKNAPEKLTLSVTNPIIVPQSPPPPPAISISNSSPSPNSSPSSPTIGGSVGELPPPPPGARIASPPQTTASTGSIKLPSPPPPPQNLPSPKKSTIISQTTLQKPPKLPKTGNIPQKPPKLPKTGNIPQKPPKLPKTENIPQKPPKLPNIKEIPQTPPRTVITNKVPKVIGNKNPSVINTNKPSIPKKTPVNKPKVIKKTSNKPANLPSDIKNSVNNNEAFSDFPKYAIASTGSNGLLTSELDKESLYTPDKLDRVAAFFEKELSHKYQLEKIAEAKDSRVYKVSEKDTIRYLHLLENNSQGTVILFTKDLINLQSLANPDKEYFEEFITKFEGVDTSNKQITFSQPEKFNASVSGIEKIVGVVANKNSDEFTTLLKSKLEAQEFTVTNIGSYGGGNLLEVKKRAFIQYISIVPSADNKGVVVVTWKQLPSGVKG
jgi:hypothetical protein